MPAGRTASVVFLGNDQALNATLARIETKLKGLADSAETQNAKMAASSEAAGVKIGRAYDEGATKAAGSLKKLSTLGGSLGVPLSGSLGAVGKHLDETTAKTEKLHESLAKLGKGVVIGGVAGFAAAAFEGVKGAAALQKQMEMLHTQAGATNSQVAQLQKGLLGMAGQVGTGPEELSKGLYHVVSNMNAVIPAAQRNQKELQALRIAAEGAKVGNADLESVTNALGAAIASGLPGVQNYQKAMGDLNATVGAGDMRMQDLSDALSTGLLGPMKRYGVSLRDVSAALAVFGDNNIRGQEAATKLQSAIRIMAAPSTAASKALHAIGIGSTQLANDIRSGGLIKAFTDLQTHLRDSGATASQQALIITRAFGGRQSTGVQLLLGQMDRLKAKYQEVGAGANKFGQSWTGTQHTLSFQMDQLKATVQALADKFGMFLIPKLQATGQAIKSVIDWMGKHKTAAEILAGVIGSVLGLAVTVFAYTKAVEFVDATKGMIGGMASLATTIATKTGLIEADTATMGASFTTVGTEVAAASTEVETQSAAMASAVTAADSEIEASNATAGASYMKLLGPIGLAVGAAQAAQAIFNKPIPTPAGGMHFANDAAARQYLQSHGAPGFAIPQLIQKLHQAGDIGGNRNTGTGAGSVGAQGIPPAIGGWSTGTIPVPSSGSNAQRIAGALKAQGFSNTAIAGILGNFAQETGGGTLGGINTRDTGTGASGMGGMGIAQWTANRRIQEMDYARLHGEAPTSLNAQIGYLIQELRGGYHGAFNAIQNAKSPQQAAQLFNQIFEGGTDPGGIRESAAGQAMAMLTGGGGGGHGLSAGLQSYLNGTSGGGGGKATMRYVNHRPVGKMTEAQWQAYQAAHPASIRELLYANPFAGDSGVTQGRTDQGVDFSAPAGSKIGAIGAGIIDKIVPNWYKGQSLIEERLSAGPDKGKFVYYAEQLNALVKQGQQVRAGQTIGRVAASGTGLELGFGAGGGRTLAQATTGYTEGEVTPAGQAFNRFLQSIGGGRYQTVRGGVVTGGGSSIQSTLASLQAAFTKALLTAGNALIQKLGNVIQSGTVRTLSSALGFSSGGMASPGGKSGQWALSTVTMSQALNAAIEHLGGTATTAQINKATGGLIAQGVAGSPQDRAYQQQVLNLMAAGQTKLANQLIAAHRSAMQALGQEEYAQQTLKDGETLNLEATHLTDQTNAITNAAQGQLNVTKAQYQVVNDAAQAQLTATRDMTQTVTDQFSGMVQSVEDHTQMMSDSMNAVVTGINDQTQTQVDVLGERGLFGLNLIAQKLQVGFDVQKAADDQAIAVAQMNLAQTTANEHQLVNNAQINLDQVTAQEDQLAAMAQQRSDTVAVNQAIRLSSAQARVDANTLHNDVSVTGPAQIAVDLGATLPKAQQDVLNAQLRRAQGQAGVSEGRMSDWLAGVQASVNSITSAAQQQAQAASDAANAQISGAQATLAAVQGEANYAIALAQGNLSGVQGQAAITEAGLQGGVSITQARASTQFAGSGLQVNIYGIPTEDATGMGNAVSWALRQQLA